MFTKQPTPRKPLSLEEFAAISQTASKRSWLGRLLGRSAPAGASVYANTTSVSPSIPVSGSGIPSAIDTSHLFSQVATGPIVTTSQPAFASPAPLGHAAGSEGVSQFIQPPKEYASPIDGSKEAPKSDSVMQDDLRSLFTEDVKLNEDLQRLATGLKDVRINHLQDVAHEVKELLRVRR